MCATIGLCDAQQIPTPARKLLAQTLMQAQQTQQDELPAELLSHIIPAQQRTAEKVGDSTQCQICEMAVNYVKVSMLISLTGSRHSCPTSHMLQVTCCKELQTEDTQLALRPKGSLSHHLKLLQATTVLPQCVKTWAVFCPNHAGH